MNSKHQKTFELIFKMPIQSKIKWTDIEKLCIALGGEITEGNGSRVRIILNDSKAVFHRPHPEKETDKGAIMSVRKFLINAGVVYHDEI
ncbi:MAG: type II toxin-antitoxin system HicA family toxin [Candidatus Chromulinivorax sp.]|nr:type II toxin-antitoxin system HicA family toxin [Candidatus Chromulinivorax sp.]